MHSPLRNQGEVKNWTTGSISSRNNLDGKSNRQCSNPVPPESTPTDRGPKMKEKRQKWSREELKENFYCFYYDPENSSGICTTERTCSLWREREMKQKYCILMPIS